MSLFIVPLLSCICAAPDAVRGFDTVIGGLDSCLKLSLVLVCGFVVVEVNMGSKWTRCCDSHNIKRYFTTTLLWLPMQNERDQY